MTREHIEHLAAAAGLLVFALLISYFHTGPLVKAPVASQGSGVLTPVSTDTEFGTTTFPGLTLSTSTFEGLFTPKATTTPHTPVATAPAKPVAPKAPAPKTTPIPAPTPTPKPTAATTTPGVPTTTDTTPSDASVLGTLKGSIVNIICVSHIPSLRGISGSGVVIDSRGIILTVAHVAQMLLLEEREGSNKISCTIRTGSPAKSAYVARPIYVPKAWLKDNPTTLISSQPTGTGEHDYALIAITASATGSSLPGVYPAISLAKGTAHIGSDVYIGSYGAQDLTSAEVRTALFPTLTTSTVTDRYTFGGNTIDVLQIAGNDAAQEGSSGGAVTNVNGDLIGIITTSSITGSLSSREMRIITTAYIERSYTEDTGKDFDSYFGDTSMTTLVNSYAPTTQTLAEFLANAIGLD